MRRSRSPIYFKYQQSQRRAHKVDNSRSSVYQIAFFLKTQMLLMGPRISRMIAKPFVGRSFITTSRYLPDAITSRYFNTHLRQTSFVRDAGFVCFTASSVYLLSASCETWESVKSFEQSTTRMNSLWRNMKEWIVSAGSGMSTDVMYEMRRRQENERLLNKRISKVQRWHLPPMFEDYLCLALSKWYRSSRYDRVVYAIVGVNVLVFAGWSFAASSRRLSALMEKWFLDSTYSWHTSTMLWSTWSHMDWWHLGFNMYALVNFGSVAAQAMGIWQFLGFYSTAGMVSMMGSRYIRRALGQSQGSLGASGALLATVAALSAYYPDMRLSVIFLPTFSFTIKDGVYGMMLFDLIGLLSRRTGLDHAGHLFGTLFGLAYVETSMGKSIWSGAKDLSFDIVKYIRTTPT